MTGELWILVASILASSMAFIDASALNVAIPSIHRDFHASGGQILWVLNSYLLMLAAFILPGGALGDKLGRKAVFMVGIVVFMLASIACGFSPSAKWLIISRFLQGLGGAFMIPGSLSLINATITSRERRGRAIGIWSSATTLVTVSGPVLGGYLADLGFWRGVFFLNIPLGLLALIILAVKVPESRDIENTHPIDTIGAILLGLGLADLSYGILKLPSAGFYHLETSGHMGLGIILLLAFLWHESRTEGAMLPLRLFRSLTFSGCNLLTLFLYGALSGGLFFLSLNMIQMQGYSQTLAGMTTLPSVFLVATLSPKMGGLSARLGPRLFLTVGPLLVCIAFVVLSFAGQTLGARDYWTHFLPGILLFGLGMSLTVAPLTTTVLHSAGERFSGTASGINNAVSRIAGVLAIAVIGAVALSDFQHQLTLKTKPIPMPFVSRQTFAEEAKKLGETRPPAELPAETQQKIDHAIHASFIHAYRLIMLLCAGLAGISAVLAFALIKNNEPSASQQRSTEFKTMGHV